MNLRGKQFQKTDRRLTTWMAARGLTFLRISIGIIFFWFGMLKFFPGMSPAEDIAIRTIETLTFNLLSDKIIINILGGWEVLIGIGLLFNVFLRETLLLLFVQMVGTFTPIFLFPSEVFNQFPFSLTIEGQYIVKNLVIVSAGIVLGATVRGGKLYAEDVKIS